MTVTKRWISRALALTLCCALVLPARAVEPLADSFATLRIDAEDPQFPERSLQVELYRRDASGAFALDDTVRYTCQVNQVAGAADFFIKPNTDGVWVEVDYLTDLDGDGVYEMLDGEDAPVNDSMTAASDLTAWSGTRALLTNGQTYILSGEKLRARAQAVLSARNTSGSGQTLPSTVSTLPDVDQVLYFVSMCFVSPVDQQEYELFYYLQLFDKVIMPTDVSAGAWYYDAVEHALDQGLFSGTGEGAFEPNAPMTRAMLWTVLAKLDGRALSGGDPWYSAAQSWAASNGVSDGSDPNGSVTREQLALMLYNLAQPGPVHSTGVLTGYADGGSVSPWAANAMAWAVAQGVLSGKDGSMLDPQGLATRAEVSAILRQYTRL